MNFQNISLQTLVETKGSAHVCVLLDNQEHTCTNENRGISKKKNEEGQVVLQREIISLVKARVLIDLTLATFRKVQH